VAVALFALVLIPYFAKRRAVVPGQVFFHGKYDQPGTLLLSQGERLGQRLARPGESSKASRIRRNTVPVFLPVVLAARAGFKCWLDLPGLVVVGTLWSRR
jgi:hypothetical protein